MSRRLNAMIGRRQPEGRVLAGGHLPEAPATVPRIAMPITNSVLWRPSGSLPGPEDARVPLFLTRSALDAIHDHWHGATGDDVLGFLIGNIVDCPETAVRYVVLHTTVAVPERLEQDDSLRLVAHTLSAVQEAARHGGSEVLGWYHSHTTHGVSLTPRDVATHLSYFSDPRHTALVFAADEHGESGGVFRVTEGDAWPAQRRSFYEHLDPDPSGSGGRAVSILRWSNYEAEQQPPGLGPSGAPLGLAEPSTPSTPAAPAAPAAPPVRPAAVAPASGPLVPAERRTPAAGLALSPPSLILPEAFDPEPLPARWRDRLGRALRWGASALAVGAVAFGVWLYLETSWAPSRPGPSEVVSLPLPSPLAGLADSVEQAVRAYHARKQLFESRQMTCADLSSGLVTLDERWLRYSVARGPHSDAIDSLKDNTLAAHVTSAERHFDRSGCPRP